MRGKLTLYVDQWGNRFFARTVRELRDKVGGGRVAKVYRDNPAGGAFHVGYVVGAHWFEAFAPVRLQA
jgi:hypothetical protein